MWPLALLALALPVEHPAPEGARTPFLSSAPNGLWLSWFEPAGEKAFALKMSRRAGARWTKPIEIVRREDLVVNWADFPSHLTDRRGRIFIHWPRKSGDAKYAYAIHGAYAPRRALGTLHEDRTATEHGFVSLIPEGRGLRAFWLDGRHMLGETAGPMSLRTAAIDGKVGPSEEIDDRVCECCGTDAAVGSKGPLVVYRDRSEGEIRDIHIARRAGPRWVSAPVHEDGWKIVGCPVNGPAIDAAGDRVAVAWFTGVEERGRIRVAFSADGGARFGRPVEIDDALGRVDLRFVGGAAIVVFMRARGEQAAILAAKVDERGIGALGTVGVTSASRASGFPRLAVHEGVLHATWTEPGPPSRIALAKIDLATLGGEVAKLAEAEPYSAVDLEGRPVRTGDRPRLLNFFARWCGPCRSEVPALSRLARRFPKLAVVGVSIDEAEDREAVLRFVREAGIDYEVWLDPENRAASTFGVRALPASVLVDGRGVIRWRAEGVVADDDPGLEGNIRAVLE